MSQPTLEKIDFAALPSAPLPEIAVAAAQAAIAATTIGRDWTSTANGHQVTGDDRHAGDQKRNSDQVIRRIRVECNGGTAQQESRACH